MRLSRPAPAHSRIWGLLRLAGSALAAAPVLLMLGTGIAGSALSGQPRMDVFLPAELSFLTLPGMLLVAAAAVRQRVHVRLAVALPVTALAALALCQGLAWCPALPARLRTPLLMALLLLFDLCAAATPVLGIVSARRLRRTASPNKKDTS